MYLVFTGSQYYPSGGWEDFSYACSSLEDALSKCKERQSSSDWGHVVDFVSRRIVYEFDHFMGVFSERTV